MPAASRKRPAAPEMLKMWLSLSPKDQLPAVKRSARCVRGVLEANYGKITCELRANYVKIMCILRANYVRITCELRASYVRVTCVLAAASPNSGLGLRRACSVEVWERTGEE